ncbi:MFS-type transporter SLC18B1-like isoform X2 [Dermacentor albipictus]|uniref:MFS-type transporter SLC18B1-like isoform X2 n=1 Tax=Dermacentor albipictus TaxID=60249 RepID=UPI0038FCF1FC
MTADSGSRVYYGAVEHLQKAEVEKTTADSESAWKRHIWIVSLLHTEIWMSALLGVMQTFFPMLLQWTSPQTCYLIGQSGAFIFSVSEGSLYWSSGSQSLFLLSLATVLLGGFAIGLYFVSLFSVVTHKFSKNPGLIIIWAYPLPFFLMSAILMLSFPWNTKLASKINRMPPPLNEKVEAAKPNYSNLMRDPLYLAHMAALTTVWVVSAFNEPTLQPSLEEFQTSVTVRGTVFAVQFTSYVFGCALAATSCHLQVMALYAFLGHLLTLTGYFIIGPVVLIQLERNLGLVYASQVLLGVGMSSLFVCAYHQALQRATELDYPDDITTHGFVSSTVFTFMVSGSIITDPIAGKLMDAYGYRKATTFMFFLLLTLTPVTFGVWISSMKSRYERRKVSKQ